MTARGEDFERFTTYLWIALLVLVLASLGWYFLVASKARAEGFSQVEVYDRRLNTDGTLWLRLQNTASEEVYVERIDAGNARVYPKLRIPVGSTAPWLAVNGTGVTGPEGSAYNLPVLMFYTLLRSGISDQVSNGTVHGTFSLRPPA